MPFTEEEVEMMLSQIKADVEELKSHKTALSGTEITTIEEYELRHSLIRPLYTKVGDTFTKVASSLNAKDQEKWDGYVKKFKTDYISVQSSIKVRIKELTEPSINQSLSGVSPSRSPSIKVPKIELPTFDGAYENWIKFRDFFVSLVHDNKDLSKVQKFHFLEMSMKLPPSQVNVLKNYSMSADNYDDAWRAVCDRYDDKRKIVAIHAAALINLKKMEVESAEEIRRVLDTVKSHLNALYQQDYDLADEDDFANMMVIHMVVPKLHEDTLKEWRKFIGTDCSTWVILENFLVAQWRSLEEIAPKKKVSIDAKASSRSSSRTMVSNNSGDFLKCLICFEAHGLWHCDKFKNMTVDERHKVTREKKLCLNCLSKSHQARSCPSKVNCKRCSGRHNTLLHFEKSRNSEGNSSKFSSPNHQDSMLSPNVKPFQPFNMSKKVNEEVNIGLTAATTSDARTFVAYQQTLLSTVEAEVIDSSGRSQVIRGFFDPGSDTNYLTSRAVEILGLKCRDACITLTGIGEKTSVVRHTTQACVSSRYGEYKQYLDFSILPTLTGNLPSSSVPLKEIAIPQQYFLADPNFNLSGPIDMLLNNEAFCEALLGDKVTLSSGPKLIHTKFGWIVGGTVRAQINHSHRSLLSCFTQENRLRVDEIDKKLDKFFAMEDFGDSQPTLTHEEQYCEMLYKTTTRRDESGRFVVQLPLKANHHKLGNNLKNAFSLIYANENRRKKDETFNNLYVEYMEDFIKSGHMEEVAPFKANNLEFAHYLPHHGVMKMSSTSTKLRPVCNASSISETGLSLNDVLCKGPTVQPESIDILMRGREHEIIIMGDITKMYRQIWVHPAQRKFMRLLWRSQPDSEFIKHYQMNTVTFGTSCAPFLATRTIKQLSIENESSFPDAAAIINNSMYVDDLHFGVSTWQRGLKLVNEICDIFNSAGMTLCKISSNAPEILEQLPKRLVESSSDGDEKSVIKALGIVCNLKTDEFSYQIKPMKSGKITKASVLSEIASIYDPIGWINPVVLRAKLFMKQLWLLKLDWCQELPEQQMEEWIQFRDNIGELSSVKISRQCYVKNYKFIEIHGFSDASIEAYGAAIYARSINEDGQIQVSLICAKSRVAPKKQKSLARLELCGALLLAKLVTRIIGILSANISDVVLWTDSTIVLHWISMLSSKLQTFVGNRVAAIQELSENIKWRHIPGIDNPADVVSRGLFPQEIMDCILWWNGPSFLKAPKSSWPQTIISINDNDPEICSEMKRTLTATSKSSIVDLIENRFSEYHKTVKLIALLRRFAENCKKKKPAGLPFRQYGQITSEERESAEKTCIRALQMAMFPDEYRVLQQQKEINSSEKSVQAPQISSKSSLISLMPTLDEDGLIRVGGRLHKCQQLGRDQKHQIILPNCRFTHTLIKKLHNDNLHPGQLALCNIVRQQFWPLKLKQIIRSVTHRCLTCFRVKPTDTNQLMASLPEERVTMTPPFASTALDYAGYYMIRSGTTRNAPKTKTYVAMFKCMCTGAIHLDLASDLSTQAFLDTLDRFISRRGLCTTLFTDNATCFEGADNELKKIIIDMEKEFGEKCDEKNIKWKFTTPRASHAGGIYESGIKSMKHHLRRVMGDQCFTFEQFQTVLCKIEAVLNSRPLTPMSDDPTDLQALTPGHFLIGRPLVAKPERKFINTNPSRLEMWQRVQQVQQQFWDSWYLEYLNTLQKRPKNFQHKFEFKVGDLVLVKDSNLPPLKWMMGRIIKLFPDKTKVVRNVRVLTPTGEKDRHVRYLCMLPTETSHPEAGQCVPNGT